MKTASLKIIESPYTEGYVVAPAAPVVASGCIAELALEALNNPRNRTAFQMRLRDAMDPNIADITAHCGNGLNLVVVSDYALFDHDYFPDKKAVMTVVEIEKIVLWIEHLEALGFPETAASFPEFKFQYLADGPTAENEFRIVTGFRGSLIWE